MGLHQALQSRRAVKSLKAAKASQAIRIHYLQSTRKISIEPDPNHWQELFPEDMTPFPLAPVKRGT
jgi:hypothetical protein